MEIFRNAQGNFELTFPLVTVADNSGNWLTGKASELDSNTVLIYYHNATVWTTASFASGTPVELGSSGCYHITILSSWFTSRNDSYPIIVKIIDDSGTKAWKDTGIIIQGKMKLEQLEISRSDANPVVKFNNGSTGNAFDLNSTSGYGMRVTSSNNALSLESSSIAGLNVSSAAANAIEISAAAGTGIKILSYNESIDLNSTNALTGIKAQRINLVGAAGLSTLQIACASAVPAVSINSTAGKGISLTSNDIGLDIYSSTKKALSLVGSTEGVSIEGDIGLKIIGNTYQAALIEGKGATTSLQILNTSTGAALLVSSANSVNTTLVQNTGVGISQSVVSVGAGAAMSLTSSTGKAINAKEIDDILLDTDEIQGELPGVGPIASQSDVQSLQNNTRYRISIPTFVQIPGSGDLIFPISFYFLDDAGLPFDPDDDELAIQIRAVNQQSYKIVLYDDEGGTTPATLNTTFAPSYYTIIKINVGEYVSYVKIAYTETEDIFSIKFKFKESTNEITIPAQMNILEETTQITLNDNATNRQIIARSMKVEEVPDAEVIGSIYKDLNDKLASIVAKLPAGTISDIALTNVVDGRTIEYIFELILAMYTGKYVKNSPVNGQLTIFKQDNTTPLAIVSISDTVRSRISPA